MLRKDVHTYMGRNASDISGEKYYMLTAIKRVENRGKVTFWLFKCDCGVEKEMNKTSVISGKTKSCGCFRRNIMIDRNRRE